MRRAISSLVAATLSLFVVSTSASGLVCDLSCWLHQTDSDCHTVGSATTGDEMAMSMPSDMDMGPDSMPGPGTVLTTSAPSITMPPQMQMVTERVGYAPKSEAGTSSVPGRSKSSSSCIHEPCAQVWSSVSSPNPHHCQANSQQGMTINISSPINSWIGFDWIGSGTPPPKILTAPHLTTTLRI